MQKDMPVFHKYADAEMVVGNNPQDNRLLSRYCLIC